MAVVILWLCWCQVLFTALSLAWSCGVRTVAARPITAIQSDSSKWLCGGPKWIYCAALRFGRQDTGVSFM